MINKVQRCESDMMELKLSKVQKAYISGENLNSNLGGVACHGYIEADGQNVSPELLRKAWKQVVHRHPVLSACVESEDKLVFFKSRYNEYVPVFDLTALPEDAADQELLNIRNSISGRKPHIEYGHTCGIALSMYSQGRTRLHFDIVLAACDVVSFQILLRDLADAYDGLLSDEVIYPKQKATVSREEDKLYWEKRVEAMPTALNLDLSKDPEEMCGCKYFSKVHPLSGEQWESFKRHSYHRNMAPHVALMAVFALTIHRFSGDKRFLLNVPVFREKLEDLFYLADDTELMLLETEYCEGTPFSHFLANFAAQYNSDMDHLTYSGLNVQSLLRRKHPDHKAIAPVVFSATPQIKLLSDRFCSIFGTLHYMVSQTPQVWIDAQSHEVLDGQYSVWVMPEGLFSDKTIDEMFSHYVTQLELLVNDDAQWESLC
jgi:yersiniabactin nonribosomal peptide synthetase